PASGAGDRKVVEVRVFFWAPIQSQRLQQSSEPHKNPRKRVFAFQGFGYCFLFPEAEKAFIKTKTGVYRLKRPPYSAPHQRRTLLLILPRHGALPICQLQVLVTARSWKFESSSGHQFKQNRARARLCAFW